MALALAVPAAVLPAAVSLPATALAGTAPSAMEFWATLPAAALKSEGPAAAWSGTPVAKLRPGARELALVFRQFHHIRIG